MIIDQVAPHYPQDYVIDEIDENTQLLSQIREFSSKLLDNCESVEAAIQKINDYYSEKQIGILGNKIDFAKKYEQDVTKKLDPENMKEKISCLGVALLLYFFLEKDYEDLLINVDSMAIFVDGTFSLEQCVDCRDLPHAWMVFKYKHGRHKYVSYNKSTGAFMEDIDSSIYEQNKNKWKKMSPQEIMSLHLKVKSAQE